MWSNALKIIRPTQVPYVSHTTMNSYSQLSATQQQSQSSQVPLFDNHGATCSLTLSSYLHSNLTNPHDRWMEITEGVRHLLTNMQNKQTGEVVTSESFLHQIRVNLQLLSDQAHLEWQGSNFHQEIFSFFKDLVDIGTACLHTYYVKRGQETKMSFKCKSMYNIYFMEDPYGNPNHTFCIYNWDAKMIVDFFFRGMDESTLKSTVGEAIYKAYKNWSDEQFTFVHAVIPDYNSKKYNSIYFLYDRVKKDSVTWNYDKVTTIKEVKKEPAVLRAEMLDFQPYTIARIRKEPSSYYGSGYSIEALPQLIQLQEIQRSITIGAQKNIEPPLNVPSNRVGSNYSSRPNAKNMMDIYGNTPTGVSPSIPQVDLNAPLAIKEGLKSDIERIYMIDKIRIEPTRRNRTATEVEKRTGEEIKLLSPFIGSLENEFLRPLMQATLGNIRKNNYRAFKQAFSVLDKIKYGVKYISNIAMSQTERRVNDIIEGFTMLRAIGEVDPSALTEINARKAAKKILELKNIPLDIIDTPEEQEAKVRQQQAQQQQGAAEQTLGSFKDAAQGAKYVEEATNLRQQRLEGAGSEEEQFG